MTEVPPIRAEQEGRAVLGGLGLHRQPPCTARGAGRPPQKQRQLMLTSMGGRPHSSAAALANLGHALADLKGTQQQHRDGRLPNGSFWRMPDTILASALALTRATSGRQRRNQRGGENGECKARAHIQTETQETTGAPKVSQSANIWQSVTSMPFPIMT